MTTPTRNTKNTNTHTPTIIQQNDVASPNNQANAVNVQINPLVQSKTVAVTAFYKLHHTTISQGRFSYKDLFTFDIMQQSAVVNGDHFDFLLSKIPQDFGFIGFVDSDLGGGKYIISVITGEEYRRNVDQETGKVDIPGETPTLVPGETPEKNAKKPKILQVSMKLPVDSQKCVKRLLFGPKSCLSVDEPVLPYAFVSDNILVSRDDLEDFCDCERMLIWFFIKDHPECKKKQGFKDLLLAHFDHAKKFQLLSSANQINLFDSDLDFALESAFGNLNELTKDAFMAFWSWYGLAIRILLKIPVMYNEGRTMLFCNSTQEVERILKYQNPGTFVIYIPKDKRNRLCVSAVAKNNPVSYVTNEWNATTVTEAEVLKFIVNNHLRVYYIHPSKRDNILWGIANIV